MKRMMAIATASCVALGATAALAQVDPATTRSESQVNSINRQLTTQQQNRAVQQQNQFENNAIRNELSRPAPPPIGGSGIYVPGTVR